MNSGCRLRGRSAKSIVASMLLPAVQQRATQKRRIRAVSLSALIMPSNLLQRGVIPKVERGRSTTERARTRLKPSKFRRPPCQNQAARTYPARAALHPRFHEIASWPTS